MSTDEMMLRFPGPAVINASPTGGWKAGVADHNGGSWIAGAVGARAFGKPCVVGIAGIATAFTDGEWVEVDGSAGSVRRMEPHEIIAATVP